MRWISRLSASEVSGPVATNRQPVEIVQPGDFLADHANGGLGGDGRGDAPRELHAIDGQRMARRHRGFIGDAQQGRAAPPHLLLQQPGSGVGRFALERIGADQFAELGRLVSRGEPRLSVDHGAHLVQVDLAAEPGRGQGRLRAGQPAAYDADLHDASLATG